MSHDTLVKVLSDHAKDRLAFDAETDSGGALLTFALAWGPLFEDSQCFLCTSVTGSPSAVDVLIQRSYEMHYGLFDCLLMRKLGFVLKDEFDTYSAARVLFYDRKEKFSLKELAKEFLGFESWGSAGELIKTYGKMENVPALVLDTYNRMDAVATWRLAELFRVMADAGHARRSYLINIESQMNHVLADMRFNGVGFDKTYMSEIKLSLMSQKSTLHSRIEMVCPGIFLSSNDDIAKRLFASKSMGGMGIDSTGLARTPKSRRVSISASVFESEAHRHPILGLIAEFKHIDKLLNTYTDSYVNAAALDGRVHSKLDSFGANTGRLSSSSPNMQNVPVKNGGVIIRKAFVSRPGYRLVDIDLSQIDLYSLAVISNDESLKKLFEDGGDMHALVASKILYRRSDITGRERSSAKAVNFGKVYGAGHWVFKPWAMIVNGQPNEDDMKRMDNEWYALFPGVRRLHVQAWTPAMQQRGYNESFYGRRRVLPKYPSNAPDGRKASLMRLLVNGDVQSTSGDIHKIGMVQCFDEIQTINNWNGAETVIMVLCVHDELLFEVKEMELPFVIGILRKAMTDIDFPLKLQVSVKTGYNWYEMSEYPEP